MENGKKTKNYDMFKFIEGNRNIKKSHLNFLTDSIEKNNLLHLRPIIVDENMNILDGQHRFLAAKELGKEIHYIQCSTDNYKELITLNRNQKNWTLQDFANFYAIQFKNENYIKLLNICESHQISLQVLFIYLRFNVKKKVNREEFEEGNFLFNFDEEKLNEHLTDWKILSDLIKEKQMDMTDTIASLFFRKGLFELLESRKIVKEQFWQRIKSNIVILHRCFNYDQVLDMLLKIYNQHSPIVIKKEHLFI